MRNVQTGQPEMLFVVQITFTDQSKQTNERGLWDITTAGGILWQDAHSVLCVQVQKLGLSFKTQMKTISTIDKVMLREHRGCQVCVNEIEMKVLITGQSRSVLAKTKLGRMSKQQQFVTIIYPTRAGSSTIGKCSFRILVCLYDWLGHCT